MKPPAASSRSAVRSAGPVSKVTFTLCRVPADMPRTDTLTLSSNVNGWKPDAAGYAFTWDAKGFYRLTVQVPTGDTLEYKVTRGSWDTVEKGEGGVDLPNRVLKVTGNVSVRLKVANWADLAPHTLVGDVEQLDGVASLQLGNSRSLWVYLPPGYRSEPARRYPVLYLQDGQNVFDAATSYSGEWNADEAAEALARAKGLRAILVAVANNADRLSEYAPFPAPENGGRARAQPYADFLVNTVKPLIDARYRTLPDRASTGILGSSMGGLISLYTALAFPGTFGFVGAMSPSFWFADFQICGWVHEHLAPPMRIYLDVGDAEQGESPSGLAGFVCDTGAMGTQLEGLGHTVRFLVAPGATHSEAEWMKRFPGALEWFLTPQRR